MKNKQYYRVLESLQVLKAQSNTNAKRLKDAEKDFLQQVAKVNFFAEKCNSVVGEVLTVKNTNHSSRISPLTKELKLHLKNVKLMNNKIQALIKSNKNYEQKINDKLENKIQEIATKYNLDVSDLRKDSNAVKLKIAENLRNMESMQDMIAQTNRKLQKLTLTFERLKLPLMLSQTSTQIDKLCEKMHKISELINGNDNYKGLEEYVNLQNSIAGFFEKASTVLNHGNNNITFLKNNISNKSLNQNQNPNQNQNANTKMLFQYNDVLSSGKNTVVAKGGIEENLSLVSENDKKQRMS